jgi:hypothetical protein
MCKQEKAFEFFSCTPSGNLRGTCKSCRSDFYKGKRARDTKLRFKYGISHQDYLDLLEEQNGGCAICGAKAEEQYHGVLDVDHNHETNEVRGLLCNSCNRAIGLLKDSPKKLRDAADYLDKKGSYEFKN